MTTDTQSSTSSPHGALQWEGTAADVLDTLPAAVLVVAPCGTIRYRNATAVLRLSDGPDLNAALSEARFLEPFEGWPTELAHIVETRTTRHFECAFHRSGSSSPGLVTLHCTPLTEAGADRVTGVVILLVEGPGNEADEQQLEISNRLASLGKLAARVAHELSNPLDGILRYVNLAMRIAEDVPQSKLKSYLTESRTGLMRMVQIIGDLLEYSRTTDGAFDVAGINEVVEQAIQSTAASANTNGVVVAADFQTQEMPYLGGTRLYQICCNLMKNAIDAMPNGGRLSITTGLVDDQVVIRIADTGVGLPEDVDTIFKPFFTTKEPGKGTGLGLTICKDFVESLQGTITAAPGEEGGAAFTVRIPIESCHHASPLVADSKNPGVQRSDTT